MTRKEFKDHWISIPIEERKFLEAMAIEMRLRHIEAEKQAANIAHRLNMKRLREEEEKLTNRLGMIRPSETQNDGK